MAAIQTQSTQPEARSKESPKKGDKFHCDKCGMAIEVTADCKCTDFEHAHFECCGQELTKA